MQILVLAAEFLFAFLVVVAIGAYIWISWVAELELGEMVIDVRSCYIRELEAVLRADIPRLGNLTWQQRRRAEARRLFLIDQWFTKFVHNTILFQSLGRCLTRKAKSIPIEEWASREFKAGLLLRKAKLCRAILTYGRLHFAVLRAVNFAAWPLTWPAVSLSLGLCRRIVERYRSVVVLVLKISSTYPGHHYENLISAL